ncbi:MAG TPA: NAD(P)H-dependent oxidoreductase [Ilumatobacteraceae bacterium]|nr:NAD(P)H-dependent oxidoreductase [Ilumatobacteraceae bacterium]HRB02634.1 NAD(P)H-dependent oxidoreductase [Ilumatobacteraceae bacterium]
MRSQNPPRILTVCGSLGGASANRSLLDVVHRRLVERGVRFTDDELLASIPPLQPHLVDEPEDEVASFRRQIADADAVIIAAPEYAGSLAGTIKNALDWIVGSGELYEKPVGVLSAGTSGGPLARQTLVRTLAWQGSHTVAHLGVAAPRTKSDASGAIDDPATLRALTAFTDAVLAAVRLSVAEREVVSAQVAASLGVGRHLDGQLLAVFGGFD